VFFIFVIANADLFENKQEQLAINSGFIQSDDWASSEINLDNINANIDANNNVEYTVQDWDTLLKIAGVFWTTVSSIIQENNLKKNDLASWQVLKVSNQVDGIVYTIKDKTNVVVFANKYTLNLQDLMTLNYVQDETEIFSPGQEVFINITKEKAYEVWLLERPKPEIIPESTITYRPTINKAGKPTKNSPKLSTKATTVIYDTSDWWDTTNKSTIISKSIFTQKIQNGFAVGYCTWYAAILRPDIFHFNEAKTVQDRPFGGDAKNRCANARAAGLSVGSKPAAGALIVYSRLNSSAGHVGKVISNRSDIGKMIVRDMNYLGKFIVTERWEDVNNSKISCYIY